MGDYIDIYKDYMAETSRGHIGATFNRLGGASVMTSNLSESSKMS